MSQKDDSVSVSRRDAGTYQMLWDCRFCGTTKLLGVTHRHCPNCGAAQDPAWRYFPAEADMVALADHKYVGADKICPACGQPNSAASTYCSECGADLATGKVAPTQAARDLGTGIAESDTRRDVVKDQFDAEMARVGAAPRGAKKGLLGLDRKTLLIGLGVVLVLACLLGAFYALTYRKAVSAQVVDKSWERVVDIQVFQAVSDAGWDESVPGDAYGVDCERRQRDTKQVPSGSHQECRDVDNGDGSFRRECHSVTDYRDEPVYDQYCRYTVNRWVMGRSVSAEGQGQQAPAWPVYSLAAGSGRFGQEKVGAQHEKYIVTLRDADGKAHDCDFDTQAEWDRFKIGAKVDLRVTITGSADCGSLKIVQ